VRQLTIQTIPLARRSHLIIRLVISRTDTVSGIPIGNPFPPYSFVDLFASGFNCDAG
jgi:hypothetical protein